MSYSTLNIWKLAKKQIAEIHKMTLGLPKFELYEEGSQIRRSSKSVGSNIVEGYGRKRYKADYIRMLTFSLASNDETIFHLETLFETKSLTDTSTYQHLIEQANTLIRMLNRFIDNIENS